MIDEAFEVATTHDLINANGCNRTETYIIKNLKTKKMRALLILAIVFILSCTKDETQKEYVKTTYTNYGGYWDYCRYQTNEIDPELKLFKTENVLLFEHEVIKDTTFCKSLNCPRNGVMNYFTRITIE
jgi:hypothetical protein